MSSQSQRLDNVRTMSRVRTAGVIVVCLLLSLAGFACGSDRDSARPDATTRGPSTAPESRNLVANADIKRTRAGSPERSVLTWAQAVQFGDVSSARRAYSSGLRGRISSGRLDSAAREVGALLGKPEIVTSIIQRDRALVRTALVSYDERGTRNVQPTTFRLRREASRWMIDDAGLLLDTAEALRRARP